MTLILVWKALIFTSLLESARLSAKSVCNNVYGSTGAKATLIFVADDGTYSGTDEATFLQQNLIGRKNLTIFDQSCTGGAQSGTIMGQPILIITSGIGPMRAEACVQLVLTICPQRIKEAFYIGTSGWPAAIGGILNPPQCNTTNTNRGKGQVTRIGDLCIPAFAVNWDCKQADWDQQAAVYPNVCSAPGFNFGPTADFLYGKCLFTGASGSSIALAQELANAARSKMMRDSMPPRVAATKPYVKKYWDYMINGTGDQYYLYPEDDTTVNVFDYKQCVEVDTQFFWSGVPWEFEARQFAATTLNIAFKSAESSYQADNVVYANAMEGMGFSMAMEDYNRNKKKKIPYTMMRAASDWSHKPLINLGNGVWGSAQLEPDFVHGYAQAIQSYSNAMLTLIKMRCLKTSKNPTKQCKYVISTLRPSTDGPLYLPKSWKAR